MSVSKKIFAGLLVTGALGAGAVPASAALSDCPSYKMCLFKDADYGGLLGYRSGETAWRTSPTSTMTR